MADDLIGIYSDSDEDEQKQFKGDEAYEMYRELLHLVRNRHEEPSDSRDNSPVTEEIKDPKQR